MRQSYIVEKYLKAGAFYQRPNAECKYKREFVPVPLVDKR